MPVDPNQVIRERRMRIERERLEAQQLAAMRQQAAAAAQAQAAGGLRPQEHGVPFQFIMNGPAPNIGPVGPPVQRARMDIPVPQPPPKKKERYPISPGKPLDIDRYHGKVRNRIALIGVEVEGGWLELPQGIQELVHDGSVFKYGADGMPAEGGPGARRYPNPNLNDRLCGELPSPPMPPARALLWIKKHHPNYVDVTCGLHVHMSFPSIQYYSKLMDTADYMHTIVEYLGRWGRKVGLSADHPLWPRLRGENKYCQLIHWADKQVKCVKDHNMNREGHRYTAINFSWQGRKTVECRLLPMFPTPELTTDAVMEVCRITNACLAALRNKLDKLVVDAEMGSSDDDETITHISRVVV